MKCTSKIFSVYIGILAAFVVPHVAVSQQVPKELAGWENYGLYFQDNDGLRSGYASKEFSVLINNKINGDKIPPNSKDPSEFGLIVTLANSKEAKYQVAGYYSQELPRIVQVSERYITGCDENYLLVTIEYLPLQTADRLAPIQYTLAFNAESLEYEDQYSGNTADLSYITLGERPFDTDANRYLYASQCDEKLSFVKIE